MSDFGLDFGPDFGPPVNPAPYQARLRYNVPIPSPNATTVLVGTSGITAIGSNAVRRGLVFYNPGNVVIYIVPANQGAVIGFGIPVYPGGDGVEFLNNPGANITCTNGWNAIAATGSNNPLTVLELV